MRLLDLADPVDGIVGLDTHKKALKGPDVFEEAFESPRDVQPSSKERLEAASSVGPASVGPASIMPAETSFSKPSVILNRDESKVTSIRPSKKAMTFLLMYLLEEGKLGFEVANLLRCRDNRTFANIADSMTEMFDDDRDAFFAAVCFFKILATNYENLYHLLPDVLLVIFRQLEGEDERFKAHLDRVQLFDHLPYDLWFRGCFAGVIPAIALDKIWDKVISGSLVILVHVGVAILQTQKRPLMTMNSCHEMLAFLSEIPNDSAEIIVNKAVESWQKQPVLVPMAPRGDSPVIIERVPV